MLIWGFFYLSLTVITARQDSGKYWQIAKKKKKRKQPWKYSQLCDSPCKAARLIHQCFSQLVPILLFLKPLEYFQRQPLYTSSHWANLLKCSKTTGEQIPPSYFLILFILWFLLFFNLLYDKFRGNWSKCMYHQADRSEKSDKNEELLTLHQFHWSLTNCASAINGNLVG